MENLSQKKDPVKTQQQQQQKQTHLHLQYKFIKDIPTLENYENLSVLYLHNNSLETITNLSNASGLTCLYLQNNKIQKLENLQGLRNLRKLFLGHNKISVVENLESLCNLEELYLEKQRLKKGESLCFDPRTILNISNTLQVLNISGNNIPSIANLEPLKNVRVFKASQNNIQTIDDILKTIQHWYYLYEASFVGNPVAKRHRYRENIIAKTIRLEILDDKQINELTRCFIKRFQNEQANNPRKSVNLADLYPGVDLPKSYPHPVQKAVSSSVIKSGFDALNISTEETAKYIPWNALPKKDVKLKSKNVRTHKTTRECEEREILRIQV